MAKKARKLARERKQERARAAGGQDCEVRHTLRNQNTSALLGVAAFRREVKVDAYVVSVDDAYGGRLPSY